MAIELDAMTDAELDSYMDKVLNDPVGKFDFETGDDNVEKETFEATETTEEVVEEENDVSEGEEVSDDLEQLEDQNDGSETQDSDINDETTETDVTEEETEETDPAETEGVETENDGSENEATEEDEGQTEEETTETDDQKVSEPETYNVKADGNDYDLSLDELLALAPKAFNYTQKMQEIAPYRRMISAIKEQGLNQDDMNLAIEILNGNKDAILSVIQKNNIDVVELDTEDKVSFTPKEYGKTEKELDIEEVDSAIRRDPEYKITQHVIGTQWDDASREVLRDNPKAIEVLHNNIKSGDFDKISPMALKLKALDGGAKSDIDYYVEAGDKYYADLTARQTAEQANVEAKAAQEAEAKKIAEAKARQKSQAENKAKAAKRKAAAPTKRTVKKKQDVMDYLDKTVSDDEFSKMMDKILQ